MVSNPFEKIGPLQRCEGQRSWKETLPHQILFSGKVVKGFFHDVPATFPQIHDAQSCFSRPRDASSFVLGLGAFAERPWRNCKTIVWHVCASKLRLMIIHTFNDKFIRLSTERFVIHSSMHGDVYRLVSGSTTKTILVPFMKMCFRCQNMNSNGPGGSLTKLQVLRWDRPIGSPLSCAHKPFV